jgi:hypothetical protein
MPQGEVMRLPVFSEDISSGSIQNCSRALMRAMTARGEELKLSSAQELFARTLGYLDLHDLQKSLDQATVENFPDVWFVAEDALCWNLANATGMDLCFAVDIVSRLPLKRLVAHSRYEEFGDLVGNPTRKPRSDDPTLNSRMGERWSLPPDVPDLAFVSYRDGRSFVYQRFDNAMDIAVKHVSAKTQQERDEFVRSRVLPGAFMSIPQAVAAYPRQANPTGFCRLTVFSSTKTPVANVLFSDLYGGMIPYGFSLEREAFELDLARILQSGVLPRPLQPLPTDCVDGYVGNYVHGDFGTDKEDIYCKVKFSLSTRMVLSGELFLVPEEGYTLTRTVDLLNEEDLEKSDFPWAKANEDDRFDFDGIALEVLPKSTRNAMDRVSESREQVRGDAKEFNTLDPALTTALQRSAKFAKPRPRRVDGMWPANSKYLSKEIFDGYPYLAHLPPGAIGEVFLALENDKYAASFDFRKSTKALFEAALLIKLFGYDLCSKSERDQIPKLARWIARKVLCAPLYDQAVHDAIEREVMFVKTIFERFAKADELWDGLVTHRDARARKPEGAVFASEFAFGTYVPDNCPKRNYSDGSMF